MLHPTPLPQHVVEVEAQVEFPRVGESKAQADVEEDYYLPLKVRKTRSSLVRH
jgi:hypothetical protein